MLSALWSSSKITNEQFVVRLTHSNWPWEAWCFVLVCAVFFGGFFTTKALFTQPQSMWHKNHIKWQYEYFLKLVFNCLGCSLPFPSFQVVSAQSAEFSALRDPICCNKVFYILTRLRLYGHASSSVRLYFYSAVLWAKCYIRMLTFLQLQC